MRQENDQETENTSPRTDPNSEGEAEIVWIDTPEEIEAGGSLPLRIKAREVTGEGMVTVWPSVRMYHVEDERVVTQLPEITVYAGKETVWDEGFLIGVSLHGETPLTENPGTLLVDVEEHVQTVEVLESD